MTLEVEVIEWPHNHKQGQWPWVTRSRDRDDKNVTITIGFLDPENIPMNNFTETNIGREVKNPRGLQLPLLDVNVGRNNFVVGGLNVKV